MKIPDFDSSAWFSISRAYKWYVEEVVWSDMAAEPGDREYVESILKKLEEMCD